MVFVSLFVFAEILRFRFSVDVSLVLNGSVLTVSPNRPLRGVSFFGLHTDIASNMFDRFDFPVLSASPNFLFWFSADLVPCRVGVPRQRAATVLIGWFRRLWLSPGAGGRGRRARRRVFTIVREPLPYL